MAVLRRARKEQCNHFFCFHHFRRRACRTCFAQFRRPHRQVRFFGKGCTPGLPQARPPSVSSGPAAHNNLNRLRSVSRGPPQSQLRRSWSQLRVRTFSFCPWKREQATSLHSTVRVFFTAVLVGGKLGIKLGPYSSTAVYTIVYAATGCFLPPRRDKAVRLIQLYVQHVLYCVGIQNSLARLTP